AWILVPDAFLANHSLQPQPEEDVTQRYTTKGSALYLGLTSIGASRDGPMFSVGSSFWVLPGRAPLPYCTLTAAGTGRGLFSPFPTFQSAGKSMIASNFPLSAANGIFDLHGRIYSRSGWDLSSVPFSARETGHGVNDDVALVTAVLQRDRKATAEFVNTCTDAVYSFIRRRLSPRHDLVDDLVQEVFIAAWESLNSFRGTSPLRAWLLGIARHKVEDYYRRLLQSVQPLDPAVAEEM